MCAFSARNLTAAISEHAAQIVGHGAIAADGDPAGKTAAQETINQFPQLRIVYPPAGSGDAMATDATGVSGSRTGDGSVRTG